jgi:hypothetical protein
MSICIEIICGVSVIEVAKKHGITRATTYTIIKTVLRRSGLSDSITDAKHDSGSAFRAILEYHKGLLEKRAWDMWRNLK